MSDLFKYFQENKDDFDNELPSEVHFQKFEEMLGERKPVRKLQLRTVLKVAAITVLFVLSSLWVYDNVLSLNANSGMALKDVSPEYKEVEFFYTSMVKEKYRELENNKLFNNAGHKLMVENEITELDSLYTALKIELKANPNDKRIVDAMINHYQLKIDLINQIIESLNRINSLETKKDKTYETSEI